MRSISKMMTEFINENRKYKILYKNILIGKFKNQILIFFIFLKKFIYFILFLNLSTLIF